MRALIMVAATFACFGGVYSNGWNVPHVCAGIAVWFGVLAATYIVEYLMVHE